MSETELPRWIARNYQLTALSYSITNKRGGLFLDPGLGKTASILAMLKVLKFSTKNTSTLLIAPLRVAYSVWPNEIEKWSNFKSLTHTILHAKGKASLWGERKDIYLINPEGLPWLYHELLDGLQSGKKLPFNTLVIDESTKFKAPKIKNKKSGAFTQFGYLVQLLPLFNRRHIMTGTPCANTYLDLWSQLFILDNGATLGINFYKYRSKYFYTENWDKYTWKLKDGSEQLIQKLVATLVLDMSSEGNIKLPKITYNYIKLDIGKKALKHYKEMEKVLFTALDNGDDLSAPTTVQARLKCRQMVNGAVYETTPDDLDKDEKREFIKTRKTLTIHTKKGELLQELIEELNGKPLLIAYEFKHDLQAILKVTNHLKHVAHIGKGVSPIESKHIEKNWNAGKIQILIGHPKSMGHGLNLQCSGNDICWYSIPESLENYLQFNKRIYRSGVVGAVRVHHLVAKYTIDEALIVRLNEKDKIQNSLREAIRRYRLKL